MATKFNIGDKVVSISKKWCVDDQLNSFKIVGKNERLRHYITVHRKYWNDEKNNYSLWQFEMMELFEIDIKDCRKRKILKINNGEER